MSSPLQGMSPHMREVYLTAVKDAWLTRISAFVVASLVVYDYFITFNLEFELIWKKPWSIIKVVFLWHRYFGFLCVIFQCIGLISSEVTDKVSSVWFRWETWATPVLLFSSEVVIILWIWIIYSKSKPILGFMLSLFLGEIVGVLYILILSLPDFEAGAHVIPGLTYCLITRATPLLRLLWIPILGFDSTLLVLYLFKGYQAYREQAPQNQSGVLRMVYKHSLLNFLAIFASYLACAVIWTAAEPGLSQIPVGFALSLSITNCTRLLLNIRRAYYIGPRGTTVIGHTEYGSAEHSSTAPIIEWGEAHEVADASELHRVDMIESLLDARDIPVPRESVEVKISSDDRRPSRWQYELRAMKAKA